MSFTIIEIPQFKAITSGVDVNFDFSESGILGKFNTFFSKVKPLPKDAFAPRDFLYYDAENKGLVWIYALINDMDTQSYETFDFDGGYYVTYDYEDGDHKANETLYAQALAWIDKAPGIKLDERKNHYAMGHIVTPGEIIKATGIAHMRSYIPIKLKKL